MASELAIFYTPMHFMWGVKSGATPAPNSDSISNNKGVNVSHDWSCDIKNYMHAHVSVYYF